MPLYDFYCPQCQREFEELVASDCQQQRCPQCQGRSQRQLPRRFSARYHGSGFYSTDYRAADRGANE